MRAKAIVASLIVWAAHSTYAFAVEPLAIDPDVTQFRFTSEAHGANKFCNLIVSAVKLPGLISLKAIAGQWGSGEHSIVFGYEIVAGDATIVHGIPSTTRSLRIQEASILSNLFSSKGFVEKGQGGGARYLVKGTALSSFAATIIRGFYFIKVELLDERSLIYVIRDDETLLDAAAKWTKCAIQIAK
jgi:hypothetical protein